MASRRHTLRLFRFAVTLATVALLSACGSSPSATGPAATPASSNAPATTGGSYPAPREETFQGCPPRGDGGDGSLNLLKNRIDTGDWQAVTLQSLLALSWPRGVEKARRATWSSADAAAVGANEGRPALVEGYILKVRHEGPESPNCHDRSARDYHVWLAASATDSRANAMVVELTPRVVARNPGWGSETSILRLAGHHVRVSGWLMLDQEHPEQLHRTRGTLWEIHPVMKIEVDQNGTWIDLASGNVALSNVSVDTGAGSDGESGPSQPTRHHGKHHRRSSQ